MVQIGAERESGCQQTVQGGRTAHAAVVKIRFQPMVALIKAGKTDKALALVSTPVPAPGAEILLTLAGEKPLGGGPPHHPYKTRGLCPWAGTCCSWAWCSPPSTSTDPSFSFTWPETTSSTAGSSRRTPCPPGSALGWSWKRTEDLTGGEEPRGHQCARALAWGHPPRFQQGLTVCHDFSLDRSHFIVQHHQPVAPLQLLGVPGEKVQKSTYLPQTHVTLEEMVVTEHVSDKRPWLPCLPPVCSRKDTYRQWRRVTRKRKYKRGANNGNPPPAILRVPGCGDNNVRVV